MPPSPWRDRLRTLPLFLFACASCKSGTSDPTSPTTSASAPRPLPPPPPGAAPPPSARPTAHAGCPEGMVAIDAATFQMGAPDPATDDDEAEFLHHEDVHSLSNNERPAHPVHVAAYCIDRTEVTTAAYTRCVQAGRCTAPAATEKAAACNYGVAGHEQHPINCVSQTQASAFCASTNARLPTEAEWEYAARGKDGRLQPWGPALMTSGQAERLCAYGIGTKTHGTCAVGSFPAGRSPFGLDDMLGNVQEWVAGYLCKYPTTDCATGSRVYRDTDFDGDTLMRVTTRTAAAASYSSGGLGFRCAADHAAP